MSDLYPDRDRYSDGMSRYPAPAAGESTGTTMMVGGLLALFLVLGIILMFGSRTDEQQSAANMERGAPTSMSPQAPRMPAETTGSGASTTGSGSVP